MVTEAPPTYMNCRYTREEGCKKGRRWQQTIQPYLGKGKGVLSCGFYVKSWQGGYIEMFLYVSCFCVFPVHMKTNISRLSALWLYATGSWLRRVLVCGLAHLVYYNSGMKAMMLPLSYVDHSPVWAYRQIHFLLTLFGWVGLQLCSLFQSFVTKKDIWHKINVFLQ